MTGCSVPSNAATDSFVVDLHIHSKYSRACSRDLSIETLTWWARRKGITLLGTGDFTHPAWHDHLREALVPAEPGLFKLDPERDADIRRRLPARLAESTVRFMLSVEISTIYKRADRTRKVHHLIYQPDFDAVARFNTALGRIGNLGSDGRPILGLDSRDLLEITLEASPDGFLVPAHIWTPWFSALGSKSGFDAIADCYADLADHIFAVETGLSSDPEMNWRVSSLDQYRLVSNSDAHSAPALAREATVLSSALDYYAVRDALRTGDGLAGTLEFFPEEGKYHADGHRACDVNWPPARTREAQGRCPECGKPLTVGVLHRVEELADRPDGYTPPGAPGVTHLIQLHEILGEIHGVGPKSKTVDEKLTALVAELGSELSILREVPIGEITRVGGELLGEGIERLRRGQVHRTPGYDGEYGVIRLFEPAELAPAVQADALFDIPVVPKQRQPVVKAAPKRRAKAAPPMVEAPPPIAPPPSPHEPLEPMLAGMEEVGTGLLDRLDALQRVAASAPGGPLLIVAGPGTGKTRTLTHRIAYLCAELDVFPEECLAITFTRRAAEEMRERLEVLLGPVTEAVTVSTFHALGLSILREHAAAVGLTPSFRIAEEADLLAALEPLPEREARRALAAMEPTTRETLAKALRARDLVSLDELLSLTVELLSESPALVDRYRARWQWIFVDEYQDVDPVQYELLRLLCPPGGNLCAIGDPDQAIYSFRGAEVSFFLRFTNDFSTTEVDARVVRLTRNYRSSAPILAAAVQAIAPSTLVPGRRLDPARLDLEAPMVGLYPAASVADEADFVVRTIDELVGGLSHRSHDGRVDSRATVGAMSFSDIAVLYRTDSQAGAIVDALSRAGVPVQKRSHDRLLDRPGIAAIARELRFATGLGGSIAARVRLSGQVVAGRCGQLDTDLIGLTEADVWNAVDLMTPLALRSGSDLDEFLGALATGAEVDGWDPRADRVTLMTLHASKGLEFPVVFLVGCEDGLLPLRAFAGGRQSEDDIAEERRLFFVGLTRAQDRLFVSHSRSRFRHGSEREMSPTPFLSAIDPGLLERRGPAAPRKPKDRQLRLI
ncbi:UvrD-helicase domain-containing protein [Dactylosporangium roseum]|uniref:DNA 3'-5' helicase n=1 Tax=Dactylosporangium roseum TaxID=47989 RepID=A0ABY5Z6T0_9ACTN|nr:UvrD-helicase domain-containing protein [Dactylosporangium roseum]